MSLDRAGDVGTYTPGGSHTRAGDDFTVAGGGRDISRRHDEFYFLRSDVTGDGELSARVNAVAGPDMLWSQAAVMWRETDADDSRMVALVRRPDGQVRLEWRDATNAGGRIRDADVARETAELAGLDLHRQSTAAALRAGGELQRDVLNLIA